MSSLPADKPEKRLVRAAIELLLIFTAGLFIYGFKLGDAPLDRTEPHRALVAHQMVTSGQWFIPKLFGEIYLRKPPLIYWIEGATEKLIGHGSEFIWRLPSAVGSALLAVILAAWSARWFGSFARLPAGIACLALIPLWEQDRGADIDALNTMATVITAMCVIELVSNESSPFKEELSPSLNVKRRALSVERLPFLSLLALSLAATLLLKGPGGFPPILGALIGPSLLTRNWKWARRPDLWIAILVGIAIFASYGIAAKAVLHHQGIATDTGGLREAMQRMVIHKLTAVIPAILAPITTVLYAVPISAVIYFAAACAFAKKSVPIGEAASAKIKALLGTIAAAFVIWILAGNDNPRYEYVALPLLAPLVGAIAVAWHVGALTTAQRNILRLFPVVFAALWALLAIILTAVIWKRETEHLAACIAAGTALCAGTAAVLLWVSGRYRLGGIAILVVLLALAVPLAERKNLERQKKSARAAALQLRTIVHGQPIGIVSMNRDMPELFYYADLPVTAFGERGLDKLARQPGGRWVVLSQNTTFPEYSTLTSQIPTAFPDGVTQLKMPDPRDKVYVGWYEPPPGVSRVVTPRATPTGEPSDDE
jgi:4-amino-4-deoxy-L-arabinose transferase-like glycosyltransferase